MTHVKNKIVIVTGGASGIGEATCRLLCNKGASVAILDVQDEAGNALVEEINTKGGIARYWHLDVTDSDNVPLVIKSIVETFGRVDGLVNNAGVAGHIGATVDFPLEDWNKTLAINQTGAFICTKEVLPYMLQNGSGSIVNISSIAGIIGSKLINPAYAASKGAIRTLTKCDAINYADKKIRINSVHPGFVWTPMVQPFENIGLTRERLSQNIPLGRCAEPIEVAYGILFLISDDSSFMTGSELVIDGGLTAH